MVRNEYPDSKSLHLILCIAMAFRVKQASVWNTHVAEWRDTSRLYSFVPVRSWKSIHCPMWSNQSSSEIQSISSFESIKLERSILQVEPALTEHHVHKVVDAPKSTWSVERYGCFVSGRDRAFTIERGRIARFRPLEKRLGKYLHTCQTMRIVNRFKMWQFSQ